MEITGKANKFLEDYRVSGAGLTAPEFCTRYPTYSKASYYQWRTRVPGFRDAFEAIVAEHKEKGEEVASLLSREDTSRMGIRLADWLQEFERSGNRAVACRASGVKTDEIEEALADPDSVFSRHFKELAKLFDWEIEDQVRVDAKSGKTGAAKFWLESKVPAFAKRVQVDHQHQHSFSLEQVERAEAKLIAKMGAYRQPQLTAAPDDVIEAEYAHA